MPNKLKYDDVKKEFIDRNLILLSTEYHRNNQKLDFMNVDGYKSQMSVANLKCGKRPCYFSKFNDFTTENIHLFLKNKNEGVVLLTQYESNEAKMLFRCQCGTVFERTWMDMQSATYTSCNQCVIKNRGINRRVPLSEVKYAFEQRGYKIMNILQYHGNSSYLEVEDIEGYKGFISLANIRTNEKMTRYSRKVNEKYFIYNLNHWMKLNHLETKVIDFSTKKFYSGRQAVKCKCSCGTEFDVLYTNLVRGQYRCAKCTRSVSTYEFMMRTYLDSLDVNYISQYRIDDCRDVLPLPFDFYLTDYDCLIEVDGEGHFFPCYFHNCSKEKAEKTFKLTQKHDKIKNKFCKEYNRKLVRIPYWEFQHEEYKQIITNLLKNNEL